MEKPSAWLIPLMFFLFTLFSISTAGDTLAPGQSIKDGESLVSAGGSFMLGFFSPGTSKNRYLGIWFNNIPQQTVAWVANREKPLTNSTGILEISDTKDLILRNETGGTIWSSNNTSNSVPSNTSNLVLQLLDSGNLVLGHSSQDFIWQSFDYPTDTVLSGMKLGWDSKTGLNRCLKSWSGYDDPSPGNCTYGVDLHGSPQLILKNGMSLLYRSGPLNGIELGRNTEMITNPGFIFHFVSNQDEVYNYYENRNASLISRVVVKPTGVLQTFLWLNQEWKLYWYFPFDQCDNFNVCGPYGTCNAKNSPLCHCFQGFEPISPAAWNLGNGSDGCARKTPLGCRNGDGFLNVTRLKLPDTSRSVVNTTMRIGECRAACLRNCSCTAYAPSDVRGTGSGCIMWIGDLMDTREFTDGGQYLFLRLAATELGMRCKYPSLPWQMRFDIITGIARGLLYLHQDSRLRVIHRDLKAGNILLDGDLNPKISDFGTHEFSELQLHNLIHTAPGLLHHLQLLIYQTALQPQQLGVLLQALQG